MREIIILSFTSEMQKAEVLISADAVYLSFPPHPPLISQPVLHMKSVKALVKI